MWIYMKRIRVKVKTLIIVLVSVVMIFRLILPQVMFKISGYISDKDREKAIKFYNVYLNTLSFGKKDEALYNMATLMVPCIDTYNIFMGMRGGEGYNITKDRVDEVIGYYEKILDKYGKSKYYAKSYNNLLDIYTGLGDIDSAYELMDWGKKSSNEKIRYISDLFRAFYYYVDKEYDKALSIVDYYIDKGEEDSRLYVLKGHIYFSKEEYDKANELYKLVDNMPYIYEEDNILFGNLKKFYRSQWIDEFSKYRGEHKIRGKVVIDGKGIPFAQIYVKDISKSGIYGSAGNEFVAITDSNGEFETVGFKEGEYEIGIGISQPLVYDMVYMEQNIRRLDVYEDTEYDFNFTSPMEMISPKGQFVLKDKEITLKWEKIEGVGYYRVQAVSFEDSKESSVTFAIPDKYGEYDIVENQATLNLDVLKLSSRAMSYSGEEMIASPQNILGTFYPQSSVPIVISAYDKDGNLINSTLPIKSFYDDITVIKVNDRELTKGENLILHKKYEEAVKYYEELLKEDTNNKEALMYLSRMYVEGWKKGTKDLAKGAEYSFRLYELIEEKDILGRLLFSFDRDEMEKHLEIFEKVFDIIPDEDLNNDLLWEKGRYYATKGDFNKCRQYYERAETDYIDLDIIYIDLYNREFDRALNKLKDNKLNLWSMNKRNLITGIEGLKGIDENSKEWIEFSQFLYKSIKRKDKEDEFNKVYKSTTNPFIKIILKEIGIQNRWLL